MDELYLKLIAAVAPAIVLAVILIRKDPRPEPLRWLLAAVGLGILAGPAVLLLGQLILPDIPADTYFGAVLTSFLDAAIPEEAMKFLALCLIASKCRYFDEVFDGVVYAVCIGMGFAGLENILYLLGAGDEWVAVGVTRALLSVPAHYFFAVIMGAFFALGKFDRRNRRFYYLAALVLPLVVHGLYDTLLFSMDISEALSGSILLLFILCFGYIRRYVKTLVQSMLKLDEYHTEQQI